MKLLFFCLNLFVFIFSSSVFFEIEAKKRRGRKRPPPLVSVSKVVKRQVSNRLNSIGTANPYRKSIVSSQIEGRVRTFPVFQGTYVEAGKSIIATLEKNSLEIDLRVKKAELENAKQDLLSNKRDLSRAKDLLSRLIIDRVNFDRIDTKYQKSIFEVNRVKALIDRISDQLLKATIRSPLTGFVTYKWSEVGEWVQKGGKLVEVVEVSKIIVRSPVSEKQIHTIKKNDKVRVSFDALNGKTFYGKVRSIIPLADLKSRTFPVEFILKNTKDFAIKAGMFSRVTIEYGSKKEAILIPKDAALIKRRGMSVFVLEDNQKVREILFNPIRSVDSFIEVPKEILKPGQKVVTQGNENLRNGISVRIRGKRSGWKKKRFNRR